MQNFITSSARVEFRTSLPRSLSLSIFLLDPYALSLHTHKKQLLSNFKPLYIYIYIYDIIIEHSLGQFVYIHNK